MSTKKISLGVSEELINKADMKVRVIVSINSIVDENGNALPDDKLKLFLYRKPTEYTDAVALELCELQHVFPVHIFNELDKPEFGTTYPGIQENLPEADVIIGADDRVDSATVPSDIDLGYYVTDRYITSRCAIFEGYGTAASEFKRKIVTYLTNLVDAYEDYANATTLMDTTTYPTGWEEVLV